MLSFFNQIDNMDYEAQRVMSAFDYEKVSDHPLCCKMIMKKAR